MPVQILSMTLGAAPAAIATARYLPHGYCYLWNTPLLVTHVVSDAAIGLAYVVIAFALATLVHRARREIPFSAVFVAFGLFIVACGFTHFMEVWTLWYPAYWVAGGVKVVTAAASVATACAMPFTVPAILTTIHDAKRGRDEALAAARASALQEQNALLQAQATELEARRAEAQLLAMTLEQTNADLERVNAALSDALEGAKAARVAAESEASRMAALHAFTAALSAAVTPSEVAEATVRQSTTVLGAAAGVLTVLTPDGAVLEVAHAVGYPPEMTTPWQTFPLDTAVPLAEAVRLDQPVAVESPAAWRARYPALTTAPHFPTAAAVPLALSVDGKRVVIGALGLSFATPHGTLASDIALMGVIASQAAVAHERARLLVAERATRADAERHAADAERANAAKSQFLANMSHELRTPLNAIAGYVQLLEMEVHGPLTADQRHALGRVHTAERHLLGLVNDVLNFAKLETGRVHFDLRPIWVADLLEDVRAMTEPQATAKGLRLIVRSADAWEPGAPQGDDGPVRVWADRDKLVQVLLNLLSNAVKFTPAVRADGSPGEVTIELTRRPSGRDARRGEAYVRVHDTGIGIPRDRQDAVFEPFVQVSTGYTRTAEGTGLGLAISRELARGMGGDLRIRSVEGEGSTFTVALRAVGVNVDDPEHTPAR